MRANANVFAIAGPYRSLGSPENAVNRHNLASKDSNFVLQMIKSIFYGIKNTLESLFLHERSKGGGTNANLYNSRDVRVEK